MIVLDAMFTICGSVRCTMKERIRSAKSGASSGPAEPLHDKHLFDMGVRAAPLRHAKRAIVGLFQDR
jgi:hypothetical protein